jgi:O-antigen ligase
VKASALELAGILAACGSASVAVLARDARIRYGALIVALIVAPALVAGNVWDSPRLVDLRDDPAKLAIGVVLVFAAIAVAATVFRRIPWTFPVALFAVLPLRVPLHLGGQTSHLLVPLYLVIAAGLARAVYAAAVAGRTSGADGRLEHRPTFAAGMEPRAIIWLRRVLAATLLLYAIQTAYSVDVSNAIENACFFLVPFAAMFVLLEEVHWTQQLLGRVLMAVAAMGLLFAAVGFWEYAARDLLLSRGDLLRANQLHLYFRVNSLFYDPNVLGRYLALTLVALGAYLAWSRGKQLPIVVAAVSAVLLVALALSYSMTSFAALVVGLLVLVALRWSIRHALVAVAAIMVCGAIFLLVSGTAERDLGSSKRVETTFSGRGDLVKGGLNLARRRPVWGWGSGSFGAAFARHHKAAETTVSHSEPITVAAEQGAIGTALYLALLALALVVLLTGAGGSAAAAVAACFVAMIAHSLGYAGFAIDPATWALLGIGIGLRRAAGEGAPALATASPSGGRVAVTSS